MIRLDKFLSDSGLGSRKQVRELLQSGRVSVNGEKEKNGDLKIDPETASVSVNGEAVSYSRFHYFLLFKPAGYLTAREDPKKPVVMELLPSLYQDLSPVGRLDEDTEGVLLLTDDGELNHRLTSPKYHAVKTYYAELDSPLPENAEELFRNPMEFSDFTAKSAENFQRLGTDRALLSITEGKYHQVKRMFQKVGCKVTYLRRECFSGLNLEGLEKGQYRELTEEEIRELKKAAGLIG